MADLHIRKSCDSDLAEIVDVFTQSVHQLGAPCYTKEQLHAWAPLKPGLAAWATRLSTQGELVTFVAVFENRIAGFISLKKPSHIELLYCHPDFARNGVAASLYQHALAQSGGLAIKVTTEASLVARPFFERQGLLAIEKQAVERYGQVLHRFFMAQP